MNSFFKYIEVGITITEAKQMVKDQLAKPCASPVHVARWTFGIDPNTNDYSLNCSYGRKLN